MSSSRPDPSSFARETTRREHDLLGEADVPAAVYWGIHTLRAVENFPITGVPVGHFPELVRALALVKQAAARANRRLGHLPPQKADAIDRACAIVANDKRFLEQFIVDAVQGGAGTSTNMNANEVIANVALELMGRPRGDYGAPASERRRQHGAVDQRRLPVRLAARADLRHGVADRGAAGPRLRVQSQGGGIRRRAQDRPHAIAGRGADDARPGI